MTQFRKAYTAAGVAFAGSVGTALVAGSLDWKVLGACVGTGLLAWAGVYKVKNVG